MDGTPKSMDGLRTMFDSDKDPFNPQQLPPLRDNTSLACGNDLALNILPGG